MDPKAEIRERALAEGFDAIGFCLPDSVAEAGQRLRRFLTEGRHGDMGWLAAKADRREHPNALWPEARSVILLGVNYAPAADPMARLGERERGVISVYAQGADYHDLIKRRLKRLGRWIGERHKSALKVFVDTAPVMEKPLAEAAGLGWQGKHTNLVSREYGSWLFLGAIYLAFDLAPDRAESDHCGSCRNCLDICPTAAFPAPYQLDARRCISYLTIEFGGVIPRGLRRAMGNRIYGCDDCLAVCPWNKFARPTAAEGLRPRAELSLPRLADLAELDDQGFRQVFAGTAIKRIGRDRLLRNVAIALGNSGLPGAAAPLMRLLDDRAPIVRAMAVWGLGQIMAPGDWAALSALRLPGESDQAVRAEWLVSGA